MRQKPIGNYIVDFFCSKLKLIIEIDGDASHRFKLTEDMERQKWLEELGLTVLRFDAFEVKTNMPNVLYSIENWIRQQEDNKNNISGQDWLELKGKKNLP
jgi:very-short-patch-repair endonuclease